MKVSKVLVLSGILAVLAMASIASAQNLLVNGDFETGDLTGWEINGISGSSDVTIASPDNGPTAPGTHNAFMSNTAEAIGLNMKQSTPIGGVGAGLVTYSFDLKLDEAGPGGVFFVQLFAEQDGVGVIGGSGVLGPFWPWNAWETFTGSFNAPAGTEFLTIQFVPTTGAVTGSTCIAHVDNVILESESAVATEAATWSGVKALYR